jgi:hypothetical protein
MEMKLVTKEQKSILAKLLASENLIVEHGKFSTASFDTKNRVLRLPIWKEMSGNLYDLLVLHEVGHALYTPEEGHHDAEGHGRGFKSFLNVVEDARIERKIKNKFPGGRRAFVEGYNDLMKRDFFGIKERDITGLGLIDRINLHYKVGDHVDILFSDEESVFIDRIDKAETWKTVVKICEDLYEYAKENESETDMSDHEWEKMMADDDEDTDWDENYDPSDYEESDGFDESSDAGDAGEESGEEESDDGPGDNDTTGGDASDEESSEEDDSEGSEKSKKGSPSSGSEGGEDGTYEPESKTDTNFRNNENELVSDEAKAYRYLNLPTNIDLKNVVVNFSDIYEEYRNYWEGDVSGRYGSSTGEDMLTYSTEKFKDFRNKNKKVVEYLAKEFEMKKAAREHSRAATANSGILSSEKLYTYKYNEHLFKKLTITPDGKNHGLVMFVDWSGSMGQNMKGTIEQMLTLVMFCKRVNIPFEVYAFSDSYTRYNDNVEGVDDDGHFRGKDGSVNYGDLVVNRFNLLNLFSSRMRAKQLHEAYIYMTATADYYSRNYSYGSREVYVSIPDRMNLGGTPLDSTLIMSFPVMRDFIKKNQVDVINSIFLTDGDSHHNNTYWKSSETDETGNMEDIGRYDINGENVILRDPISKKQIQIRNSGRHNRRAMTSTLVKFLREVFDINIVNFFLIGKMRKWDMMNHLDEMKDILDVKSETEWIDVDLALKKFRKDKYIVAPEACGFNEQYLILGGKNLEVQEEQLEVAEDASVAQLARAFKKFSSGKLEKRKLLSRFIDMVAA